MHFSLLKTVKFFTTSTPAYPNFMCLFITYLAADIEVVELVFLSV